MLQDIPPHWILHQTVTNNSATQYLVASWNPFSAISILVHLDYCLRLFCKYCMRLNFLSMFSSPVSCTYLKQSWHVFWPLKVLYIILTFSSRGGVKKYVAFLYKRESTHVIFRWLICYVFQGAFCISIQTNYCSAHMRISVKCLECQ